MKVKRVRTVIQANATLLLIFGVLAILALSPVHAGGKGNKVKELVCHYNDEGELEAKLLPKKAAEAHFRNHFPDERPYTWSDGTISCEPEPVACPCWDNNPYGPSRIKATDQAAGSCDPGRINTAVDVEIYGFVDGAGSFEAYAASNQTSESPFCQAVFPGSGGGVLPISLEEANSCVSQIVNQCIAIGPGPD